MIDRRHRFFELAFLYNFLKINVRVREARAILCGQFPDLCCIWIQRVLPHGFYPATENGRSTHIDEDHIGLVGSASKRFALLREFSPPIAMLLV
ncbi:hypothetical protein [Dyadobacter sp. BHUBP1]|uniref:hypothetical protein n=1 Tax=Dyadobacter sp. BHUBP1 TaxID=3424178 RepID=UPI003D34EA21